MQSLYDNPKLEYIFYNPKDEHPMVDAKANLTQLESMGTEDKILNTLRDLCYTPPQTRGLDIRGIYSSPFGLHPINMV